MCARIFMEECYMRLSLQYKTTEERQRIQETIVKTEIETNLFPNVLRKSDKEELGTFSIEFSVPETLQREAGLFFEQLMNKLNITKCEN